MRILGRGQDPVPEPCSFGPCFCRDLVFVTAGRMPVPHITTWRGPGEPRQPETFLSETAWAISEKEMLKGEAETWARPLGPQHSRG